MARAEAEQAIEDYNSFQRGEGSLHRRVICLPLTEHFDPPPGQQGHGKLQVSDRVSIPKELMTGVFVVRTPTHCSIGGASFFVCHVAARASAMALLTRHKAPFLDCVNVSRKSQCRRGSLSCGSSRRSLV